MNLQELYNIIKTFDKKQREFIWVRVDGEPVFRFDETSVRNSKFNLISSTQQDIDRYRDNAKSDKERFEAIKKTIINHKTQHTRQIARLEGILEVLKSMQNKSVYGHTNVGYYQGKIDGYEKVNEILEELLIILENNNGKF